MKAFGLHIGKLIMNICYFFIKLFPMQNNKVTMISRQSDEINVDFKMLQEEFNSREKNIKIKVLCKKIPNNIIGKIGYCIHMIKSMYHIATSKICIIDGYCIPISILKHKRGLIVLQIWHAMGAIKQFGYQILGKKEGNSSKTIKIMEMHKNYTYITCTSQKTKEFYSQAFHIEKEKILILGMPRIDYLLGKNQEIDNQVRDIKKHYPSLQKRPVILYAPTFRKNKEIPIKALIEEVDHEKYQLIIKLHPLDKTEVPKEYAIDNKINTMDLLKIADYVITDYSAIAFEVAILEKKLFFYLYDEEIYDRNRGVNIDLKKEMSEVTSNDIKKIISIIEKENYPKQKLEKFKQKYVETADINNTKRIVDKLLNEANIK